MDQFGETSVVDVLDALNPPEDDVHLRPQTCTRDPARICGARRLNDRVRQVLAVETLAGLSGIARHDSDTSSRESRAEHVYVTQGESRP